MVVVGLELVGEADLPHPIVLPPLLRRPIWIDLQKRDPPSVWSPHQRNELILGGLWDDRAFDAMGYSLLDLEETSERELGLQEPYWLPALDWCEGQ